MMSTDQYIRDRAAEIAKALIEAKLDTSNLAQERISNFQVSIRGNYQCPKCAIELGESSILLPVGLSPRPNDTTGELFRCTTCGFEIRVPGG